MSCEHVSWACCEAVDELLLLDCGGWNVNTEQVFDKMLKADISSECDVDLIYIDVHDAVLAAMQRDATLCQQVRSAAR